MNNVFLIVLWFNIFDYVRSQYITVGTANIRNKVPKSSCDDSNKGVLVEQFFNIIFNEFHNTPPACVCVQMCPDQPTYCYPNGCLKRVDGNKKPETLISRLDNVNTRTGFFLEEKNDFINDFVNKNYVDENKAAFVPVPFKQSNVIPINIRPDPFKDRYKILFKYKKMPKVELKYNLGEQVKNTKSDAVKKEHRDVSKTRWPRNKMNHHVNGYRTHANSDTLPASRFYVSNTKEIVNDSPKYFKRELVNNTNFNKEEFDLNAIYVVGKKEIENTPFSLEKLIDSLIENSFDSNDTFNIGKDNNNIMENSTSNKTSDPLTETANRIEVQNRTVEPPMLQQVNINATASVISMNLTEENVERNKYTEINMESSKGNTHDVNHMIASLAKRIEIQNNTSLEMIRRMGDEFDFVITTTDKIADTIADKENVATVTTETTNVPVDFDLKTTKKSRQRLAKRLINSKNN